MSIRAGFLIVAASAIFHISWWAIGFLFLGYYGCALLDARWAKRAREEAIDWEMDGWEKDPDDPECEFKGQLGRVRLTGQDQALFHRMAAMLRSMPVGL